MVSLYSSDMTLPRFSINAFIPIFILIFINFPVFSQDYFTASSPEEDKWVDSVFNRLTPDEMIAQLMIIRANKPGKDYFTEVDKYIRDYHIGGVTFFGGHPVRQARQTNYWQSISKTPLFICIDAEWGLGMRLDSTVIFPFQMTLGAISDDSLIYRMACEIARQCKRLGIQVNFAPVVDVNSNPNNPVINMRSFGENKFDVTRKGLAYMRGLQENGILATAKHFPGHGDTDTDSHLTLPIISNSRERLDSLELYPFKQLIGEGLSGIMIAHLYVPAYESKPNTPTTLSGNVVTRLLKEEMGFKGLVVTDALDMKGVMQNDEPGEIEVKALQAGNDILLLSDDVPVAIQKIRDAIVSGDLTAESIREKCRKVLHYKYRAGLSDWKPVETEHLYEDLNTPEAEMLNRKLFENAITLIRNKEDILPLVGLDKQKIASVSIGYNDTTIFQERLSWYAPLDLFFLPKDPTESRITGLLDSLRSYGTIIVSLQNTSISAQNCFGINDLAVEFITRIGPGKKLILDIFASPYSVPFLPDPAIADAILISYQDHPLSQDISAQVIFGGISAKGRLPVTSTPEYPLKTGIGTKTTRLKYTIPEELGICRNEFNKIDSLVNRCIDGSVFPGCQVMAVKDGKVFFIKSYGYHTYKKTEPVLDDDLYDIASLTKIMASVPSVMCLKEEGKLDIDKKLEAYLPELKNTNKGTIIIREMLAHQARLKPWIPFYKSTLKDGKPEPDIYSPVRTDSFPVRVAEGLYIKKDYEKVIFDSIARSPLMKTNAYTYSDLGYFFVKKIVESLTLQNFDDYARTQFYLPLGLPTMDFNPRQKYPLKRIVPTELDTVFRRQLLHGDVDDPAAAMLGGVAGHAGLFSDANDVAVMMQLYLQGGTYGGVSYFDPSTIKEFTARQYPDNNNRRGIGFDKPLPAYDEKGPACKSASANSFGHSGFTGTYAWADPDNGLVYVFLSNRVCPDASNNKLSEWNIRTKIHQYFYDAIEKCTNFANPKN